MFTGIVEGTGRIASLERRGGGVRLKIAASFLGRLPRGASVAVDGVCLTAERRGSGWFEAELSPETLARTTLGAREAGDRVNLERALRLGDRLGGHLVQGHVDGIGMVEWLRPEGRGARLRVACPPDLGPLIVEKGSIAVDGVSLTVAARDAAWFEAAIIPETLRATRLGARGPGAAVNLEVDLVGRYVVQFLAGRAAQDRPASAVTRAPAARHGSAGRSPS